MVDVRDGYLNFNTATYVLRQNRFIHFDITRSVVIDIGRLSSTG